MPVSGDETCPIPLETLGLIYRLPDTQIADTLSTLTPLRRAELALYCVQRNHLRAIGLLIAARCEYADLYVLGGKAGAALFENSREPEPEQIPDQSRARRKITLAIRAA